MVGLDDPRLRPALTALAEFVTGGRGRKLSLERIDGEPVVGSPVEETLVELGFRSGPRKLTPERVERLSVRAVLPRVDPTTATLAELGDARAQLGRAQRARLRGAALRGGHVAPARPAVQEGRDVPLPARRVRHHRGPGPRGVEPDARHERRRGAHPPSAADQPTARPAPDGEAGGHRASDRRPRPRRGPRRRRHRPHAPRRLAHPAARVLRAASPPRRRRPSAPRGCPTARSARSSRWTPPAGRSRSTRSSRARTSSARTSTAAAATWATTSRPRSSASRRRATCTESEVVETGVGLLQASIDNTVHQIGLALGTLLEDPARWARVVADRGAHRPGDRGGHPAATPVRHDLPHRRRRPRAQRPRGAGGRRGLRLGARGPARPAPVRASPTTFRWTASPSPPLMFGNGPYSCLGSTWPGWRCARCWRRWPSGSQARA